MSHTDTTKYQDDELIDDKKLQERWTLASPRLLAYMRQKRMISFIKLGYRTIRYPWPTVLADIKRFEVRAVGREKK